MTDDMRHDLDVTLTKIGECKVYVDRIRTELTRLLALERRVYELCPGRECGEESEYGKGWDAATRAHQKWLKEGGGNDR